MKDDIFAAGASASLQKTINEITDYLTEEPDTSGLKRRDKMRSMITQLVFEWTEWGFYLGHSESYRRLRDDGEIPATLCHSEGTWEVLPKSDREFYLESRIRRT